MKLPTNLALLGGIAITSWTTVPLEARADISGDQQPVLQEVIVTAQKRPEDINSVPISLTALSQKTMDDLSIQTVADLASIVPGVALSQTQFQDAGAEITIRGIKLAGGSAPTTQLYIDDTSIAIRQLGNVDAKSPFPYIFDLDRVEVLRGPQGTLFGASAMGGAIRFITPQPSLTTSSGSAKAQVGYTDGGDVSYEVGAAYGGPVISDELGFRVSAWYQSLGGFIDREDPYTGQILEKNANSSNASVIRPAVTWAPSEGLTVTAAAFLQHQYTQNADAYWATGLAAPEGGSHYAWGGTPQPMTDDLRVGSLSITYEFAGLSLVSDTSYLDRTSSTVEDLTQLYNFLYTGSALWPTLPTFFQLNQNNSSTYAWQQEFRLSSGDSSSKVNWLVGAYFRRSAQGVQELTTPDLTPLFEAAYGLTSEDIFGVPNYTYNGQVLNGYASSHATDRSVAMFGNLTVLLLSHLKLDVGVRVEHLAVEDQQEFLAGPSWGLGVESALVTLPDAVATPVTPRASLAYEFAEGKMVYASAAKGFRSGGGNDNALTANPLCGPSLKALGLSAIPGTYGPDSLWSYEVGTKGEFFDRGFSIQASAFYSRWADIQSVVGLPSCGAAFTANEGRAISQGFDLQLAGAITRDLKIGALVGYTHAYYPDAVYGTPNPSTGVPPLLQGAGDAFTMVPPWSAAVNTEYSRDVISLWSGARAYIRLDYRWTDGPPVPDPNVANFLPENYLNRSQAFGTLNLRLGAIRNGLDLSVYVDNVTNSNPRLSYTNWYPGQPVYYATTIRPLTFGVTGWYRF